MMKKIATLSIALLITFTVATAQSENYKPFKVDLGVLYGIGTAEDYSGGIGFYIEPKYNITDNIAVGLKGEVAIIGGADVDGQSINISAISTYQLTGDYYFGDSNVRPFGGLGVGIYSLGSVDTGVAGASLEYGSNLGFAPRVGLLLGHLRLAAEYNIITGAGEQEVAGLGTVEFASRNYISIKLGFEIGGGRN